MQVVYSGGMTSTPLSSPRCYRKESPGGGAYTLHYPQNPNYPPPPPSPRLLHKQLAKQQQRQRAAAASGGGGGGDGCRDNSPNAPRPVPGSLRNFIPAMKRPVAIACCVCNVLVPGLGTFLSGLTLKCGGSHSRLPGKTDRQVILTNMWVASLQFLTTFLFLLGWIWSVTWACAFITFSGDTSSVRTCDSMTRQSSGGAISSSGGGSGSNITITLDGQYIEGDETNGTAQWLPLTTTPIPTSTSTTRGDNHSGNHDNLTAVYI